MPMFMMPCSSFSYSNTRGVTGGVAWLSGGAPDRPCRLSGVPPARALLVCARRRAFNALQSTVAREVVVAPLSHRTVRCAPDSPVNYSRAPLEIPEGEEFSLECPGAPDSPVRQTRVPSGLSFALLFEPFSWSFYWLIVNLWHL
jgi:hypothetical protein